MMASLPSNKRSRKYSKAKLNWGIDASRAETDSNNMLDPSTWVVGTTGSQAGFTHTGLESENAIIESHGPTGELMPTWASIPSGDASSDGGWWPTNYYSCNDDKAYRFSVFFRRYSDQYGTFYLGYNATGTPDGYDIETGLPATTGDDNPYFVSSSIATERNEGWFLCVGYIMPQSYAGVSPRGGVFRLNNGVKTSTAKTYRFASGADAIAHRSFYHSSPTTTNRLYQTAPRMEPINGSEPPLATILAATATFTADYQEQIVTGADGSENTMYVQTTMPSLGGGDYWIDYSTGENRVFWRDLTGVLHELEPFFLDDDPTAPSGISIISEDSQYSSVANSGKRSVRRVGPHKFKASISYPPQTKREFAKVDAFLTKIRNTGDPFFLSLPNKKHDKSWNFGEPRTASAGEAGYEVETYGWAMGYNPEVLDRGQYIKIEGSDKLYLLREPIFVRADNTATVKLANKLQFSPVMNARLTLINPEMKCHLIGVHRFEVSPPELYSYRVDVEEVID